MDVVDAIRAVPGAHRDRGTLFEQLTAEYLRRDPVFAARFSKVWLWSDWPSRGTATDTGIDLVAEEADGSGLCAVQCKLYDPQHQVSKADVDTFFSASGKRGFTSRLIVSTTDRWSSNAEATLADQTIPVSRIGLADMAASPIEWDASWIGLGVSPTLKVQHPHSVRPHQQQAIDDVFLGWATGHDRGQLVMACGTGKTFTALKIAERLTVDLDRPVNVLFLVPSIALLSQALREWTAESTTPMHCQAVCSDPKSTAEARRLEDVSAHDLPLAASTDPQHLLDGLAGATAPLRVVFSTYQSIDQVAAAVKQSGGVLDRFDLVVCDEAHRTTGVTLAGQDESHFQKVHDNDFLPADRRLYMTATPKIFADETKQKAAENEAVLASMDNPTQFGPVFHRLGFGKAVDQGLLADYRVLILTVDETFIAKGWQEMLADAGNELTLDDAARIVGCWNGLAKRSRESVDPTTGQSVGFPPDAAPMRRAVAFTHTIKASKALAEKFEDVTTAYTGQHAPDLRCEVEHVDGTMNSLTRNEKLAWLKAPTDPDVCRILSNARCLSEGVDVPTLDAVLFLTPRNSVVDVVQSVGRVMRSAPGKEYGYVILPVAVPADMAPEEALRDNQRYKVVWQVLQALRAHDDRFNATINKIDLNTRRPDQIMVLPVTEPTDTEPTHTQGTLTFPVELLTDAVYSRIVSKVGQRTYWEQLAKDVAQIAQAHVARITAVVDDPDSGKRVAFQEFLEGLQATINPGIDKATAIDMLAQHLVTRPVFEALFADYQFLQSNPVSVTMQRMLDALEDQSLDKEQVVLHDFYESVRLRAEGVDNHAGRQRIMTELYEKFFKTALPKTADALGIVYTPIQVVDFILRTTDQALQRHLGSRLTDEGVQVLDPFTGTGTFISRLLASGLIEPHDLARKYTNELNANEMVLLAYYIAAVNIEAAYHDVAAADNFKPFDGIVLTDTFQMSEDADVIDHRVFSTNTDRGLRQLGLDIRVIIGNPPYSVGQTSMNDANQNLKYPTLDRSIEQTYAARSTATNKNALYDSYIRAFRWASNRIGGHGVIAFVSNGGWIDGNVHDGMRQTLAEEFDHIYVFNLRGNARGAGELRAKEAGNIFGGNSRTTVAIALLVKTGGTTPAQIHYCDIGDYLSREDKLAIVEGADLDSLDWQTITPNTDGDWINQRSADFQVLLPIGDKTGGTAVFATYSSGLKTNRDAWVYNFDQQALLDNLRRMVSFHNEQVLAYQEVLKTGQAPSVETFIDTDPTKISWNRADKTDVRRGVVWPQPSADQIRINAYRPFTRQHGVLSSYLCDMVYRLPTFFPTTKTPNVGIYLVAPTPRTPFSVLAVDGIPDVGFYMDAGQLFARYTYLDPSGELDLNPGDLVDGYRQVDNITDQILAQFQTSAGTEVTKDGIFHYLYGLLHSPDYRQRYAADLKKMLPRVPVPDATAFKAFATAGEELARLHLDYEQVDPYPLTEEWLRPHEGQDAYRVTKMAFCKKAGQTDRTRIAYNALLTLSGIPEDAYRYTLGSRSAIEWIIDRYQIRTDKASGIVNDPNTYSDDPRYIVDLLKRIVTVSLETMRIVDGLPPIPEMHKGARPVSS